MNYRIMSLNTVINKEPKLSGLSFVEAEKDIPFAIKRIYCIYKTEENQHRGFHAHKKNWQLLFCPYGSIEIILSDGTVTETVLLDEPSKGLVLYPGLWREMNWKQDDSVLCVAASEYCDENENIRNFNEFLLYRKQTKENPKILERNHKLSELAHGVRKLRFPFIYSDYVVPKSVEIEGFRDVPFEIKRLFFIFGKGNVGLVRGKHANRKSEFVLFNISGRSKVKVIDEEKNETVYELNYPNEAVYLPRMVWKEMYDFTEDAVLMVVTNEYYDVEEYVRDFEEFAEEVRGVRKKLKMN